MSQITVTLYHATWCHYCVEFESDWNKFKKMALESGINTYSFEHSELNDSNNKINGNKIKGYPTLKISFTDNNKNEEFQYKGKRNPNEMINFLKDKYNL
jgi:hypothetical protein